MATLLTTLLAVGASAPAVPPPVARQVDLQAEGLRTRLDGLVRQTRSASWVQTVWERKGKKEQFVRSRCLWSAEGLLRMEVQEGRGAGTTLLKRGDRVIIKPPGILGAFKLNRHVEDQQLRSLRGRDLDTAGFFPDLEHVLENWSEVELSFDRGRAVMRYPNSERLVAKMAIVLESLAPVSIEAWEDGEVVERTTFDQVRFGVPVDPDKLAP